MVGSEGTVNNTNNTLWYHGVNSLDWSCKSVSRFNHLDLHSNSTLSDHWGIRSISVEASRTLASSGRTIHLEGANAYSCWAAPDRAVKDVSLAPPVRRLRSRQRLLVSTVGWRMGLCSSIWKGVGCVWALPGSIPEEAASKVKNTEGAIGVGAESSDPLHFSGFKINSCSFHPRLSKHFADIKILYWHMDSGKTVVGPKRKCRNIWSRFIGICSLQIETPQFWSYPSSAMNQYLPS